MVIKRGGNRSVFRRLIFVVTLLFMLSYVTVTGFCNSAFIPKHSMNILKNISKSHFGQFCRRKKSNNYHKPSGILLRMSSSMIPPVARRDEDCVVMAGKVDGDDKKKMIRQLEGSSQALLDPPRAVSDPYGWLRDESRTSEEVLKHLKFENDYTKEMTSHRKEFQDTLYKELVSYLQETDHSVLIADRGYYYYTRTIEGFSYRLHCRAPISTTTIADVSQWDGSVDSPIVEGEEVYLNVNELAKDQSYCAVSSVRASPSSKLFSYAIDVTGDEVYSLVVKNFATGEIIDILQNDDDNAYDSSIVWGKDDDTYFYLIQDEAHRPYQVYKRTISTQTSEMIYEDLNDLNWVGVYKSSDNQYLFIDSSSPDTSEIHFVNLDGAATAADVQIVATREEKQLYEVDHWNGNWIISTNDHGTLPNMKLCVSPAIPNSSTEWKDITLKNDGITVLFDGSRETSVSQIQTFEKYIAVSGRQGGIPRVWILSLENDKEQHVYVTKKTLLEFPEQAYDVDLSVNRDFQSQQVLLYYSSLITPPQWIQVPMEDHDLSERIVLKQNHIPNYNKEEYDCQRFTVLSRDGQTEIPVSMLYRKDVMDDDSRKVKYIHQYGYGSYGASCEADFNANRLPLLNRGMIYVCAHVRGGGEMGRYWYDDPKNGGKYLCKQNTFHDFVDVSKYLKEKYDGCQLSIEGRSAGGLLIGASINQAPDLYKVAILGVPFVDVVCTMIDSTIPLTCTEWEEWGNPNEETYFDYMMSYSPINNVKKNATYPSCLLTGGLHDPRGTIHIQSIFVYHFFSPLSFLQYCILTMLIIYLFKLSTILGTNKICSRVASSTQSGDIWKSLFEN